MIRYLFPSSRKAQIPWAMAIEAFKQRQEEKKKEREEKKREKENQRMQSQNAQPSGGGMYTDMARSSLGWNGGISGSPSASGPTIGGGRISKTIFFIILIAIVALIFFFGYLGAIFALPLLVLFAVLSKVQTGRFFPVGIPKTVIALFLIIGMIVALFPIIAGFGVKGMAASLAEWTGLAADAAQRGVGAYQQQLYKAMGMSYASDVDEYADEDIGVSFRDVEPTQQHYIPSDPVTIWGYLDGKAMQRTINVSLGCIHERTGSYRDEPEVINGYLSPTDRFFIDDEVTRNFRCEFPQGILDSEDNYVNRIMVTADFNFETMSYITASFMDEDAYFALEQSDPERLMQLSQQPVAQTSAGPIDLGIGSKEFPILIRDISAQSFPYVGFSINNGWEGYITDLTHFSVLVPKGMELMDCDGEVDMEQAGESEFFRNYTMGERGLSYLTKKLTVDDGAKTFVPQNFKCFLGFDEDVLFQDRNRLDPISLNIFAFAEYEYKLEERITIPVRRGTEDYAAYIEPSIIGLSDVPTYKVIRSSPVVSGIQSASVTIEHRKRGERDATIIPGYDDKPIGKDAQGEFEAQVTAPLVEIIPELKRGDSLIMSFDLALNNGETDKVVKVVRILNHPPEVKDLSFLPSDPGSLDDITCTAEVEDSDDDSINATFTFRNQNEQEETEIPGICERAEDAYTCVAKLSAQQTSPGDVIECSASLFDGIDYNRDMDTKQISIGEGSSENSTLPSVACNDSDGGIALGILGETTGFNDNDILVSVQDTCTSATSITEYYCGKSDNRVKSREYPCDTCSNGVCY